MVHRECDVYYAFLNNFRFRIPLAFCAEIELYHLQKSRWNIFPISFRGYEVNDVGQTWLQNTNEAVHCASFAMLSGCLVICPAGKGF